MGLLCTHPPPGSVVPGSSGSSKVQLLFSGPFAVHRLAKGPQPGQEGGTGSVIGSPFVDLEGNVDS